MKLISFPVLCCLLLIKPFNPLCADENDAAKDKTLSPYLLIMGDEEAPASFPLLSSHAEVVISGVIAEVTLVQTYGNNGTQPIEAKYCFPLSTRAAVHGMEMEIGDRRITAKIEEKKKAKAIYEKAKNDGKTSSLLEEHRPNVFEMNVANILPGDNIVVTIHYVELIVPEEKTYAFIFPTVVGPRFSEQEAATADPSSAWIANPYLESTRRTNGVWSLDLTLNAGMPVQDLNCPSHTVAPEFLNEKACRFSLHGEMAKMADRDFIFEYRLAGSDIETGLILHKGDKENFFLFMAQPPARPAPAEITARDYIFLVDVSGSMFGFPLETSKEVILTLLQNLRPEDKFNIVFFAGASESLYPTSKPASQDNIRMASKMLEHMEGSGGTRLLPAMEKAFALPLDETVSRTLVVLTDGYVDVEMETFELIRTNLGKANLFAFGIGSSVNRFLIEGIAREGQGEPFVVTDIRHARREAQRFVNYIKSPVLTKVDIDFIGLDVYDVEPESIPDIFAERPVLVYGKWRGNGQGNITLKGISGEEDFNQSIPFHSTETSEENPALKYLWARQRMARLSDYTQVQSNSELEKEIINLGITYNLLSKFTSFVAVDEIIRNESGSLDTVKQPLPLPKGVSSLAFTQNVASTPEPQTYLLILSLGLMVFFSYRRYIRNDKRS